jgi:hypothetical protein
MRYQPASLLERFIGGCFGLLVAALALYFAVRLIEAIWLPLVGIALGVATLIGLVMALRWHRQGW